MKNIAKEFDDNWRAWKAFTERDDVVLSSLDRDYIENPHFEAIVRLGPEAVPYIIEKLQSDEGSHFLIHALERITRKSFTPEEMVAAEARYGSPLGNQGLAAMWQDWWKQQQSGKSKE